MNKIIQARVGEETLALLKKLRKKGYSDSQAIRDGLNLLAMSLSPSSAKKRIIGLGKFDSGIQDLGSNKKHLEGFGDE